VNGAADGIASTTQTRFFPKRWHWLAFHSQTTSCQRRHLVGGIQSPEAFPDGMSREDNPPFSHAHIRAL